MNINLNDSPVITAADAAELSGVTIWTIHNWRRTKGLRPEGKIGGTYLFLPDDIARIALSVTPRRPRRCESQKKG